MFRQDFEMTSDCKKVETMFTRFSKKYPEAWEVWGGNVQVYVRE